MAVQLLRGLVLLCTLWSLAPRPLSAQGLPPLSVHIAACATDEQALELDALLELLGAEIAPRELLLVGPQRNANLMIDGCQADELVLSRSGDEPRLSRLALHDVLPALRPRVAALAAAELVFTSDGQPTPTPREPPANPELAAKASASALSPSAPSAAGESDQAPRTRQAPPGRLAVGGETRLFFTAQSLHFGPRAVFSMKHSELSLFALFGRQSHVLGEVRTGLSALGLQVPIWQVRRKRAELTISLGGELGISWGGGTPSSSYQTSGTTRVGPFAALPVRLALGGAPRRSAYLRAEVGVGYAYGLTGMADGQVVSTTHGPFAVFLGLIGTRSAPH